MSVYASALVPAPLDPALPPRNGPKLPETTSASAQLEARAAKVMARSASKPGERLPEGDEADNSYNPAVRPHRGWVMPMESSWNIRQSFLDNNRRPSTVSSTPYSNFDNCCSNQTTARL